MKKYLTRFLLPLTAVVTALCSSNTMAQTWTLVDTAAFSSGEIYHTGMCTYADTPFVVFTDAGVGNKTRVMKYNGSHWVQVGTTVSTTWSDYCVMAIDGTGAPIVAYSTSGITAKKYFHGNWVPMGLADFSAGAATYTSIAIDTGGTPYVAYCDGGNHNAATVMKFTTNTWVPVGTAGFSAGGVLFTALAFDNNGTPYIAFQDSVNNSYLTVMKFNGTSWVTVGSAGFSGGIADWISIAIDPSGAPYVAYSDASNGYKAMVMKYNGSSWMSVGNVVSSPDGGITATVAIAADGTPYVGFEDGSHDYKASVFKYDGSNWQLVGAQGFSRGISYWTSIALSASGAVYMAYSDDSASDKATVMRYGWPAGVKNITGKVTSLAVSPNPTHGLFILNISTSQEEEATITITNVTGEKVKEFTAITNANTEVQLNAPAGIYFVTAATKTGSVSKKIVVE